MDRDRSQPLPAAAVRCWCEAISERSISRRGRREGSGDTDKLVDVALWRWWFQLGLRLPAEVVITGQMVRVVSIFADSGRIETRILTHDHRTTQPNTKQNTSNSQVQTIMKI